MDKKGEQTERVAVKQLGRSTKGKLELAGWIGRAFEKFVDGKGDSDGYKRFIGVGRDGKNG